LPEQSSQQLPSRGQVAVEAVIGGQKLHMVLEPDGYWGHWVRVSDALQKTLGVKVGDTVTVELAVTKDWPEPELPADFKKALDGAPQKVTDKWKDITPMARWEWIRWVNSTGNNETRAIRIEKSISKLNGKHRRPCCFNLAACTEPYVAKSGRLIGAEPVAA
jgi:predicted SPOUT superfamily RNA methylase MTH1